METKSIVIDIPDGMCIDESKSTFEKIVFKKKENTKPRSWEEYCSNVKRNSTFWISSDSHIVNVFDIDSQTLMPLYDKNTFPSKELAEAFLAMMQLMSLRQAWIGDWKPDWSNINQKKANILCNRNDIIIVYFGDLNPRSLSFPTKETAEDFMNCFKDLLEIAKPLI